MINIPTILTENQPASETAENGHRAGTCPRDTLGRASRGHLISRAQIVRSHLRTVLFWIGEALGALCLFAILFTLLFLGELMR